MLSIIGAFIPGDSTNLENNTNKIVTNTTNSSKLDKPNTQNISKITNIPVDNSDLGGTISGEITPTDVFFERGNIRFTVYDYYILEDINYSEPSMISELYTDYYKLYLFLLIENKSNWPFYQSNDSGPYISVEPRAFLTREEGDLEDFTKPLNPGIKHIQRYVFSVPKDINKELLKLNILDSPVYNSKKYTLDLFPKTIQKKEIVNLTSSNKVQEYNQPIVFSTNAEKYCMPSKFELNSITFADKIGDKFADGQFLILDLNYNESEPYMDTRNITTSGYNFKLLYYNIGLFNQDKEFDYLNYGYYEPYCEIYKSIKSKDNCDDMFLDTIYVENDNLESYASEFPLILKEDGHLRYIAIYDVPMNLDYNIKIGYIFNLGCPCSYDEGVECMVEKCNDIPTFYSYANYYFECFKLLIN